MAIRKYAKAMQTKECFLGFVCPYCGHINLKPASFTGKGVSNAYIVATEDKIITEANESATENAEFVYSSHRNRINKKRDFDGIGGTCDKCLKTTSWNTQDYYKRLRTAVSKFKGMMVALLLIFSLVCMFKQAHSYVFQVLMAWTIFLS